MNNKKIRNTNKKPGNFTTVSYDIIRNKNLTSNAKILLIEILSDSDDFELSQSLYCKRLGWEKNQFTRAIEQLEIHGFIKRTRIERDKVIPGKKKKGSNRILYFYTVSEFGNLNSNEHTQPEGDLLSNKVSPTQEQLHFIAVQVTENKFYELGLQFVSADLYNNFKTDKIVYDKFIEELAYLASKYQDEYVKDLKSELKGFNSNKYPNSLIKKMEDRIKKVVYTEKRIFNENGNLGKYHEAKSYWMQLRNDYNRKQNNKRIDPETAALND